MLIVVVPIHDECDRKAAPQSTYAAVQGGHDYSHLAETERFAAALQEPDEGGHSGENSAWRDTSVDGLGGNRSIHPSRTTS